MKIPNLMLCAVWLALLAVPSATAQSDQPIFADDLLNGWQNWSWAQVKVGDTAVAQAGTRSVKVTIAEPWQALYLQHPAMSSAPYASLGFWIHGGATGGQRLNVHGLRGGKSAGSVRLDPLTANAWKQIVIPLSSLGVAGVTDFDGFWLIDVTGAAQPAFHVDEVRLLSASGSAGGGGGGSTNAVAIVVNAAMNRRAIDPRIYGVAYASAAELAELNAPLNRWGGNSTTRYNWKLNAHNTAFDWFFQSHPDEGGAVPGAAADLYIARSRASGAEPMLTLPAIGWVAKLGPNRSVAWSYSVAKYGAQQQTDVWHPDSGNGRRADGTRIANNDPNEANQPAGIEYQAEWVRHLTNRWGSAGRGGVRYYLLDNEPSIWHGTHPDVHPAGATMEEVRDRLLGLAEQVKAIDPDSIVVGPEEWGWLGLLYSGADQQYAGSRNDWSRFPDREAHGNMDFLPWFLDQSRQRGQAAGRRLLDVVTTHLYPAGIAQDDVSEAAQLLRNRSTRALWDPNYTDESWIAAKVNLIPRLRNWVETYYPGTRIGITEYNWGWAENHMNAATAQADLLGIFGREGVDLANRWTTPTNTSPTFKAMKLYRNYDGRKSTFGETSLAATVPNPDSVAAFAAERASDGALTAVVINKQLHASAAASLSVSNFAARGTAEHWQLADAATGIRRLADVAVAGGTLSVTLPPQSISLFVVPPAAPPVAVPPRIRVDSASAGGEVRLTVEGQMGRGYAVQASSDLASWAEVTSVVLEGATTRQVTVSAGGATRRFFRLQAKP